jgi:GNAT superfamily N-acetyltransferase
VERLTGHAELLAASGDDPWVRWCLPDPLTTEAWVHQGVALVQRLRRRPGFWVAPLRGAGGTPGEGDEGADEAGRVRAALVALRDGGHLERLDAQVVSVVQEHAAVAHEVLVLGDGGDWEWRWTTTAPPYDDREAAVVVLDDRDDADELGAFTRAHQPRVWTEIGTGRVVTWRGVRDAAGALVAIGGAERSESDVPHLAGIVTATSQRGRGWGGVVSAALTRWALSGHEACTLGMYRDNTAARRVYDRLGYRTARSWHSRALR